MEANLRVTVWMRDLPVQPDDPRRSVLSRLRELATTGAMADVSVHVWGQSVIASDDRASGGDHQIRKLIADFRRWADRHGYSLEPAFQRTERSTMVSEERIPVIRLPLLCLAVYGGGRLVGVFPHSTDDGHQTVGDYLDRLEAGDVVGEATVGKLDTRSGGTRE